MNDPETLLREIFAREVGANWDELGEVVQAITDDAEMNRRMSREWRAGPRQTQEEVCRYYAESKTWLAQTYNQGHGALLALAEKRQAELSGWARAFKELLPTDGATILDYGGGFLKDTWFFAVAGAKVVLAEIEGPVSRTVKAFVEAIGERNVEILPISGDVPDLGLHDGAVCFEVLEHMVDPVGAARRIVSAVRPGGPVALSASFGAPEHAPYHIAGNSHLSDPEVWWPELRRMGLEPEPVYQDKSHARVWRKLR